MKNISPVSAAGPLVVPWTWLAAHRHLPHHAVHAPLRRARVVAQFKNMRNIRVGARGSHLSKIQSELVIDQLRSLYSNIDFSFVPIKTQGDNLAAQPTFELGVKGLFVKEIEMALQKKQIDLAVHSAKDLASDLPEDLVVCPALARAEPWDVLVTVTKLNFNLLAKRSTIGTSSLRRQAFLNVYRPDLILKPLRGNVGTRLRAVGTQFTGVILAQAALSRLNANLGNLKTEVLPKTILPPAPGQGQLAFEYRRSDHFMEEFLKPLYHLPSALAFYAERAFVRELGIGCSEAISALANFDSSGELRLEAAKIINGQVIKVEKSITIPLTVQLIKNGRVNWGKKDIGPAEFAQAENLGKMVASSLKARKS